MRFHEGIDFAAAVGYPAVTGSAHSLIGTGEPVQHVTYGDMAGELTCREREVGPFMEAQPTRQGRIMIDWSSRWSLCQLTPEAAEAHDRRVHMVKPEHGLGWKPYTYRATRGAVAQWACHTEDELARKLNKHHLKIREWSEWSDGGLRIATIESE